MIQILLIVIGIILLLWFLLPVIAGRIMNIGTYTGLGIGLVLLLYGIFLPYVNRFLAWFWYKGYGRVIEIVIGAIILAILVLAAITMICMGSAASKTAQPNMTVIVLGCKVRGDRPSLMLTERLDAAYDYLMEYPETRVIVSGGQGEDEIMPEAEIMYEWLVQKGIAPERIMVENRSTDTHENLAYCYEMIEALDSNLWTTDVVIATNEFHEYRALRIADDVGFQASPLPAKTAWWLFPTYYVREMYGILEDWFLVQK